MIDAKQLADLFEQVPKQEIKLFNNVMVPINDWISASMYSAVPVHENLLSTTIRLFDYGVSEDLPGRRWPRPRPAKDVHTNIPRRGSSGLPPGWGSIVLDWSAHTSYTEDPGLVSAVREWADTVVAKFAYNHKTYWTLPLSRLLDVGALHDPTWFLLKARERIAELQRVVAEEDVCVPKQVIMREHIDYYVDLLQTSEAATHKFMKAVEDKELTLWVHLWGYWSRAVI